MFDDEEEDLIEYLIFDDAMKEADKSRGSSSTSFGGLLIGCIMIIAILFRIFM